MSSTKGGKGSNSGEGACEGKEEKGGKGERENRERMRECFKWLDGFEAPFQMCLGDLLTEKGE